MPLGEVAEPLLVVVARECSDGLKCRPVGVVGRDEGSLDALPPLREEFEVDEWARLAWLGDEERGVRFELCEDSFEEDDVDTDDVRSGSEEDSVLPASLAVPSESVTTLQPTPLSLVAGMNKVEDPSCNLTESREGWLEAQQPLSSDAAAVE